MDTTTRTNPARQSTVEEHLETLHALELDELIDRLGDHQLHIQVTAKTTPRP